MTTQTTASYVASLYPAYLSLPVMFLLCLCSLLPSLRSIISHANNVTDISTVNAAALGGLAIIFLGTCILFLSLLAFKKPKLKRKMEKLSAFLSIVGGILYLIPLLKIEFNITKNSCYKQDSNIPCYYTSYYTSIIEFIPVRVIIVSIFILLNDYSTLWYKIFLYGCDFGVTAALMIGFWINWYNDDSNNGSEYQNFYYYTIVSYGTIFIVTYFGLFIYQCYKSGWINKTSMKVLALKGSLFMFISGIFICYSSIFAMHNNLFNNNLNNGFVFNYFIFGLAIGLQCEIYTFIVVYNVIKMCRNNNNTNDNNNNNVQYTNMNSIV